MKNVLITLITSLAFAIAANAQVPDSIKYQAVLRDATGTILTNQSVNMQFTIYNSSLSMVWQDTYSVTSNGYGLVNMALGGLGLADLSWGTDTYTMETAVDFQDGNGMTVMGTSTLLSVPYAFHAKTAETALSAPGDNLGDHTATQDLDMGGNNITNATDVTATGTATLGGNTYPTTTGTSGQTLTTDGAGNLSWGSSSSGVNLELEVSNTSTTLWAGTSTGSPKMVNFNSVSANSNLSGGNTWTNDNTFTVGANGGGLYMVQVQIITNAESEYPSDWEGMSPIVEINGDASRRFYGWGEYNNDSDDSILNHNMKAQCTAIVYLSPGDYLQIKEQMMWSAMPIYYSSDGTTNVSIVKLN